MKRMVSVAVVVMLVGGLAGAALAWGPGGGMWGDGPGWGMMGGGPGGMMGRGGPGAGPGGGCPGWGAGGPGAGPAGATQITDEQAKQIANEYAQKYFQGYTVERVLPYTGRFRTMYQVELKGPKGESRNLHITPWGGVRPFGGPFAASEK